MISGVGKEVHHDSCFQLTFNLSRKIHSKFYYLSKEECSCVLRKAESVEIREKSLGNEHDIKCWQEHGAIEILTRSSRESKSWNSYQWNTIQQFKE